MLECSSSLLHNINTISWQWRVCSRGRGDGTSLDQYGYSVNDSWRLSFNAIWLKTANSSFTRQLTQTPLKRHQTGNKILSGQCTFSTKTHFTYNQWFLSSLLTEIFTCSYSTNLNNTHFSKLLLNVHGHHLPWSSQFYGDILMIT